MLVGPGAVIATRYRLEHPLGEGASAQVFRAMDLMLDEPVAIKLFSGPFDPARRARFRREINLARKLAHTNIVRIYELVAAEGVYGLTMEIVDGLPLDRFVDDARRTLLERHARPTGRNRGAAAPEAPAQTPGIPAASPAPAVPPAPAFHWPARR